ncbi:SLC2A4 regulator isoform X1 [Microcebus murinus]|nr:SLC2A4 regulator isoform X2 [Microcebus murinus]
MGGGLGWAWPGPQLQWASDPCPAPRPEGAMVEQSPGCRELRLQWDPSPVPGSSWRFSTVQPELGEEPGLLSWAKRQAAWCAHTCLGLHVYLGQGRGLEHLLAPPAPAPISSRASPAAARLEEVMAAAALTSLSTSPLLLGAPAAAFSPEPGLEPWKEALARPPGSYSSSSASGEWGWDLASDQSSPSTPSPPLPLEAAHFLFGEPTLRKRKSSAQAMFQCLWKSCGKVLSSASGMQRHIRLVHLGRQAEPEQSDGEEDFYYTELDAGVDTLTDGLSSLTPASPTASLPPTFSRLELPESPVLTSMGAPQACHSDHAYPVGEATGGSWGQLSGHSGGLEPQPTEVRACVPALPARMGVSLRKPRGDAKKCRKVYGMDHRDLWCTACRWKKACQRFLD